MLSGYCPSRFGVLFCSVRCARLPIHLQLLDRVVSGARFLTGVVFQYDIAHHLSVAVLCMLYEISCNPMHTLYGALPVKYMCQCALHAVLWSHIGILMRILAAESGSTAGPFIPHSVFPYNDLADPVFDGVGIQGFKSRDNAFLLLFIA